MLLDIKQELNIQIVCPLHNVGHIDISVCMIALGTGGSLSPILDMNNICCIGYWGRGYYPF